MKLKYRVILASLFLVSLFCLFYIQLFSLEHGSDEIYVCQIGVFSNESNAVDMVDKVRGYGFDGLYYKYNDQFIVLAGMTLVYQEAVLIGEDISALGMASVIKQYYVDQSILSAYKEGEYKSVLEALES